MIIVNLMLKVVVASSAAYLSSQCARNMIETRHVVNNHHHQEQQHTARKPSTALSSLSSNGVSSIGNCDAEAAATTGTEQIIVEYLSSLTKRQLLELFCQCESPSVSLPQTTNIDEATLSTTSNGLYGDWDGYLLANNGLTKISNILSHTMFSGLTPRLRQRRRWIGKRFSSQPTKSVFETDAATASRIGINRFRRFDDSGNDNIENDDDTNFFFNQHQFDYGIENSKIQPGTKSLFLKYNRYQSLSFLSPWYTMRDEIRVVPESFLRSILTLNSDEGGDAGSATTNTTSTTTDVLLGMGSMAWSGGALNSAPFCLIRSNK